MDFSNIDLSQGVVALVLGMTTVFLILLMISGVISMFTWFDFTDGIKLKRKRKQTERLDIEMIDNKKVIEPIEKVDDLELVAVITVAIAAAMNTTTDNLEIISFRHVTRETRGSWTIR